KKFFRDKGIAECIKRDLYPVEVILEQSGSFGKVFDGPDKIRRIPDSGKLKFGKYLKLIPDPVAYCILNSFQSDMDQEVTFSCLLRLNFSVRNIEQFLHASQKYGFCVNNR